MIMKNLKNIAFLFPLILIGCSKGDFKESKTFAGGKVVTASTLNLGQTTYMEYCVSCHGVKGDGNGIASKGMYPPPRNFTIGIYKFANVVGGELPHDEDFYRIIRHGLKGSAMLPWDISDERLDAVVQYIKTFAPQTWEGADKVLGTKYELPADPFGDVYRHQAIEKGKKVYHVTAACIQCHRGYETKENISKYNEEINKVPLKPEEFASDLYLVKLQDGDYNYKVVPPDFTFHPLRSITDVPSIVQRLMYGVNGSGMPGWKDVVSDEELWALAYYVQSLRDLKDTPARFELLDKLDNQK
jgi:mono/diheme cytochrome c family protein